MKDQKLFNILFHVIRLQEYDFVRFRQTVDSKMFSGFLSTGDITFVKLREPGFSLSPDEPSVVYFAGKHNFFHVPFKMLRFLKKKQARLLFVHSFLFPVQVLALRLFLPRGIKIIVQHHAERPFENRLKKWLQRLAYRRCDAFLFASKGLAAGFIDERIVDEQKLFEVMETSSTFVVKDPEIAETHRFVGEKYLWVGRLNANKDPFTVLKAMKIVKLSGKPFRLYMIFGTSDLETEVRSFIEANDLSGQVTLLGKIDHAHLENWYNYCDYFISASFYEGGGIALCEAMSCGCIPVVTDIPSFRMMTGEGRCGAIFPPGDPEALARKLAALEMEDKKQLRKIVLDQFSRKLSFETIASQIERIVLSLTSEK